MGIKIWKYTAQQTTSNMKAPAKHFLKFWNCFLPFPTAAFSGCLGVGAYGCNSRNPMLEQVPEPRVDHVQPHWPWYCELSWRCWWQVSCNKWHHFDEGCDLFDVSTSPSSPSLSSSSAAAEAAASSWTLPYFRSWPVMTHINSWWWTSWRSWSHHDSRHATHDHHAHVNSKH